VTAGSNASRIDLKVTALIRGCLPYCLGEEAEIAIAEWVASGTSADFRAPTAKLQEI
jgi:hypothetical protein